jgi:aminoglycoside phosphotransferase (APT) family kinase protein
VRSYRAVKHEHAGFEPVLAHGDVWLNNLIWRQTNEKHIGNAELLAIIDWQLCHAGSPVEDLSLLLSRGVR